LRKTHEAPAIAAVGADEVRRLPGSAHKSLGASDCAARIVDRAHRWIAHRARRALQAAQRSQLPLPKHLGLCVDAA